MDASELRIGNYVYHPWSSFLDGHYSICDGKCIDIVAESANPIPLTEEWLIKFGFSRGDNKTVSDSFYVHPFGGSELCINPENGVVWIERNESHLNVTQLIEFVHTLQNLYHAWTGEELTIKDA